MTFETVGEQLRKRGYLVTICETAAECAAYLDRVIDGTSVGIGGSTTIWELGLYPMLRGHNTVYWHNDPEQAAQYGVAELRKRAQGAEIYLSSVNGLSEDGVVVNIDHTGNRIASLAYGHKKVYLIVGRNKLASNPEQALWRARNVASPKNAQRLQRKTPCAQQADRCYDCDSPERICRGILIQERAMGGMEMEVVLVNADLGF